MTALPQAANTEGNNEQEGFDVIPAGTYVAAIVKSEMKETKAGTGSYLNLHLKVQEGEFAGRMVFDNLNLVNPNAVAVSIANKKLNSICEACGQRGVEDSDELHGIDMKIQVGVQAATDSWPESNKIMSYKPVDGAELPWE